MTFSKREAQNEWRIEAEVVYVVSNYPVSLESVAGIRITYNPEKQSMYVDLSAAKPRKTNRPK